MRVSDRMLIPCKVAISSETGNDFVENPSEEIISHRVRRDRKKGFRD